MDLEIPGPCAWVEPVGCGSVRLASKQAVRECHEEKKRGGQEQRSHADDLDAEAGTVRSRVALLLRSAEVNPVFS